MVSNMITSHGCSRMTVASEQSVIVASGVSEWNARGRPKIHRHVVDAPGPRACPSYPPDGGGRVFARVDVEGGMVFGDSRACEPVENQRFVGPCVSARCGYWDGHCQLGVLVALSVAVESSAFLTDFSARATLSCPIRPTCRWLAENGEDACSGCQGVTYFGSERVS